jgi:hypothetical protein
MEFTLCSYESALPCEVTVDEDNGRYMIRKSDSSGEFFNTAIELINWVHENWTSDEFCNPSEFSDMIEQLNSYQNEIR